MLAELHGSIEQLVHHQGQVPASDVDVRFEAPRRDWVASLTRPTLSFFLFHVQENTDLRHTNLETSRDNGRAVYRVPPRRFDLRYMVSALTSVVEDEHLLLWRALVTLLKHPTFPAALLPDALRLLDPPLTTQVSKPDDAGTLLDLWSGLETAPRPALLYVVTAPVDLDITRLSPLVLTRTARYASALAEAGAGAEVRTHIGGTVRDGEGRPIAGATVSVDGRAADGAPTGIDGTFTLPGVAAGAVTLRVMRAGESPKLVRVEIPSESYDIVV